MPEIDQLLRRPVSSGGMPSIATGAGEADAAGFSAAAGRSHQVLAAAAVLVVLVGLGVGGYWLVHGSGSKQSTAAPANRASEARCDRVRTGRIVR